MHPLSDDEGDYFIELLEIMSEHNPDLSLDDLQELQVQFPDEDLSTEIKQMKKKKKMVRFSGEDETREFTITSRELLDKKRAGRQSRESFEKSEPRERRTDAEDAREDALNLERELKEDAAQVIIDEKNRKINKQKEEEEKRAEMDKKLKDEEDKTKPMFIVPSLTELFADEEFFNNLDVGVDDSDSDDEPIITPKKVKRKPTPLTPPAKKVKRKPTPLTPPSKKKDNIPPPPENESGVSVGTLSDSEIERRLQSKFSNWGSMTAENKEKWRKREIIGVKARLIVNVLQGFTKDEQKRILNKWRLPRKLKPLKKAVWGLLSDVSDIKELEMFDKYLTPDALSRVKKEIKIVYDYILKTVKEKKIVLIDFLEKGVKSLNVTIDFSQGKDILEDEKLITYVNTNGRGQYMYIGKKESKIPPPPENDLILLDDDEKEIEDVTEILRAPKSKYNEDLENYIIEFVGEDINNTFTLNSVKESYEEMRDDGVELDIKDVKQVINKLKKDKKIKESKGIYKFISPKSKSTKGKGVSVGGAFETQRHRVLRNNISPPTSDFTREELETFLVSDLRRILDKLYGSNLKVNKQESISLVLKTQKENAESLDILIANEKKWDKIWREKTLEQIFTDDILREIGERFQGQFSLHRINRKIEDNRGNITFDYPKETDFIYEKEFLIELKKQKSKLSTEEEKRKRYQIFFQNKEEILKFLSKVHNKFLKTKPYEIVFSPVFEQVEAGSETIFTKQEIFDNQKITSYVNIHKNTHFIGGVISDSRILNIYREMNDKINESSLNALAIEDVREISSLTNVKSGKNKAAIIRNIVKDNIRKNRRDKDSTEDVKTISLKTFMKNNGFSMSQLFKNGISMLMRISLRRKGDGSEFLGFFANKLKVSKDGIVFSDNLELNLGGFELDVLITLFNLKKTGKKEEKIKRIQDKNRENLDKNLTGVTLENYLKKHNLPYFIAIDTGLNILN